MSGFWQIAELILADPGLGFDRLAGYFVLDKRALSLKQLLPALLAFLLLSYPTQASRGHGEASPSASPPASQLHATMHHSLHAVLVVHYLSIPLVCSYRSSDMWFRGPRYQSCLCQSAVSEVPAMQIRAAETASSYAAMVIAPIFPMDDSRDGIKYLLREITSPVDFLSLEFD